jgi:hypothetical protein
MLVVLRRGRDERGNGTMERGTYKAEQEHWE